MTSHKDEALRALEHVRERLAGGAPLEGLDRHQLRATVEYALEQMALIQEVKRQRRAPGDGPSEEPAGAAG